jgi:hypothetical protein
MVLMEQIVQDQAHRTHSHYCSAVGGKVSVVEQPQSGYWGRVAGVLTGGQGVTSGVHLGCQPPA